jgi:hypothetical protein
LCPVKLRFGSRGCRRIASELQLLDRFEKAEVLCYLDSEVIGREYQGQDFMPDFGVVQELEPLVRNGAKYLLFSQ